MTETARLVERIDTVLDQPGDKTRYGPDDAAVLAFCRRHIAHPERRPEDDQDVSHLHKAAKERLKHYEKESIHAD